MLTANGDPLEAARVQRESLYDALIGLEDALATPIGDAARWRLRIAMAADHAAVRLADHIISSEGENGLLRQIDRDSPRLRCRTNRLRDDHLHLAAEARQLASSLAEMDDTEVVQQGEAVRMQALNLLSHLSRHRQRGADLVYEAYQVDIGCDH